MITVPGNTDIAVIVILPSILRPPCRIHFAIEATTKYGFFSGIVMSLKILH